MTEETCVLCENCGELSKVERCIVCLFDWCSTCNVSDDHRDTHQHQERHEERDVPPPPPWVDYDAIVLDSRVVAGSNALVKRLLRT